jgi:hypothetical protein
MHLAVCITQESLDALQITYVETDGACVRLGGEEKCVHSSGRETWRKETAWKHKPMWEDNIEKYLKYDGRAWTGFIWLGIGTVAGCCEKGSEPQGFIKCGRFLHWLRDRSLLKKDCCSCRWLGDSVMTLCSVIRTKFRLHFQNRLLPQMCGQLVLPQG